MTEEHPPAVQDGRLRWNFQGYTDDACPSLVGLGASAISSFRHGFVQTAAATAAYAAAIRNGRLATIRGHAHSPDDRLRTRAIEMPICGFALDLDALERETGEAASALESICLDVASDFALHVVLERRTLTILPEGRPPLNARIRPERSSI